jgi:hypothetical protein
VAAAYSLGWSAAKHQDSEVRKEKPAKWATALHHEEVADLALSHASRGRSSYPLSSWGSAALHLRLYASTRSAGLEG